MTAALIVHNHVRFNSTLIYSDRKSSQGLGNGGVTLEPTFVPRPGDRPVVLANDNPFNPFGIDYKFPATPIGDFTVQAHATHVILFNETTPNFNGGGGFSTQGFVNTEQGGLSFPNGVPANKANLDLDWNYGNWSAHYHVNFIEGITEPCNSFQANTPYSLTALGLCSLPDKNNNLNSKNRLRDTFYHNMQLSYAYPQINTTFTIGVNNLFDRNPPVSYSAFQDNYDPTLYRPPGRFLYGRIVTRF